jgi:hypothetical protein
MTISTLLRRFLMTIFNTAQKVSMTILMLPRRSLELFLQCSAVSMTSLTVPKKPSGPFQHRPGGLSLFDPFNPAQKVSRTIFALARGSP